MEGCLLRISVVNWIATLNSLNVALTVFQGIISIVFPDKLQVIIELRLQGGGWLK